MIREDITAGRYGIEGRPNIQTVHEIVAATPEELESYRPSIEKMVEEHIRHLGALPVVVSEP